METSYNITLVGLSFIISVLGSYTALQMAIGIPASSGKNFWLWLIGAAFSLGGGGIWAMHFIAMLAYQMPMEVAYDTGLTLLSLAIATFVVGLGFLLVGRSNGSGIMLLSAGSITGLGVASMHYLGMEAMRMPGLIEYNQTLVGVSIAIAIAASIVALWLAFNLRGHWQRIGSAVVMGVAVCGMHYTGMSAATVVPTEDSAQLAVKSSLSPEGLATVIFGTVVVFLLGLLLGTKKQFKVEQAYTYRALE